MIAGGVGPLARGALPRLGTAEAHEHRAPKARANASRELRERIADGLTLRQFTDF